MNKAEIRIKALERRIEEYNLINEGSMTKRAYNGIVVGSCIVLASAVMAVLLSNWLIVAIVAVTIGVILGVFIVLTGLYYSSWLRAEEKGILTEISEIDKELKESARTAETAKELAELKILQEKLEQIAEEVSGDESNFGR